MIRQQGIQDKMLLNQGKMRDDIFDNANTIEQQGSRVIFLYSKVLKLLLSKTGDREGTTVPKIADG